MWLIEVDTQGEKEKRGQKSEKGKKGKEGERKKGNIVNDPAWCEIQTSFRGCKAM